MISSNLLIVVSRMNTYSTREAANKLNVHYISLQRYITSGKVPAPKVVKIAGVSVRVWSAQDIAAVRKVLPKIANGRKTRYQKLREKQRLQPKAAMLRKSRKPKNKK